MELFSVEKGKGRPIVLIHGFCETHEIWRGFDDALANSYRVISIDLPGFGRSALPEETLSIIQQVAQIILRWLKKKDVQRPVLVGHSLGGYVILAMAEIDPLYCKDLVLFHSSIFSDTPEKKENRNKVMEFVREHGVPPFIETFVPSLFYKKDKNVLEQVKSICLQTKKETLLAYTGAMRDRPDRQQTVSEKVANLLIISGDRDGIIPPEIAKKMAAVRDGIKLVELPETGHMGMIESPEIALAALKNFAES
jgi:pimeloyl-ACP methyl ester carboxylesterase